MLYTTPELVQLHGLDYDKFCYLNMIIIKPKLNVYLRFDKANDKV